MRRSSSYGSLDKKRLVSVSFLNCEKRDQNYVYLVQVKWADGTVTTIKKRYNQFDELEDLLRYVNMNKHNLPQLSEFLLPATFSKDMIARQRFRSMEQYFEDLLDVLGDDNCQLVKFFSSNGETETDQKSRQFAEIMSGVDLPLKTEGGKPVLYRNLSDYNQTDGGMATRTVDSPRRRNRDLFSATNDNDRRSNPVSTSNQQPSSSGSNGSYESQYNVGYDSMPVSRLNQHSNSSGSGANCPSVARLDVGGSQYSGGQIPKSEPGISLLKLMMEKDRRLKSDSGFSRRIQDTNENIFLSKLQSRPSDRPNTSLLKTEYGVHYQLRGSSGWQADCDRKAGQASQHESDTLRNLAHDEAICDEVMRNMFSSINAISDMNFGDVDELLHHFA